MGLTVKEIFDEQFEQVRFDSSLCRRVIRYSEEFMIKNDEHSAFFGGVLLGVHRVRFLEEDRRVWYDDILQVDEDLLAHRFKSAEIYDPEHKKIGSDVFNYTSSYLIHRLRRDGGVPRKLQEQAEIHAMMVLHYRFATSILSNLFRYSANPEVAQATFMNLTGRFDIRRFGSWRDLFLARSQSIVSKDSIYNKVLNEYKPDEMVRRVATDTQTRIRGMFKGIYAIHLKLSQSGVKTRLTSDIGVDEEGEKILKDKRNKFSNYLRYAKDVLQDEDNWVKSELIDIIISIMPSLPEDVMRDALKGLSREYDSRMQRQIDQIVEDILLYAFDHMVRNPMMIRGNMNLPFIMTTLKSHLIASRSSDPTVLKLRDETEKFVKKVVRTRNVSVIASVRTGMLLYIVLRTITKSHYDG